MTTTRPQFRPNTFAKHTGIPRPSSNRRRALGRDGVYHLFAFAPFRSAPILNKLTVGSPGQQEIARQTEREGQWRPCSDDSLQLHRSIGEMNQEAVTLEEARADQDFLGR